MRPAYGLGLSFDQMREWFNAANVEVWDTDFGMAGISENAGLAFEVRGPADDISMAFVVWDTKLDEIELATLVLFLGLVTNLELTKEMLGDQVALRDGTISEYVELTETRRIVFESFWPIAGVSATVTAR